MPNVKLFALIPRKPGLTEQAFHDHWRHPHGTLACGISVIRKYVQSHHVGCDLFDRRQSTFEGIAEVWMDSITDALWLAEEPWYVRHLAPDEPSPP